MKIERSKSLTPINSIFYGRFFINEQWERHFKECYNASVKKAEMHADIDVTKAISCHHKILSLLRFLLRVQPYNELFLSYFAMTNLRLGDQMYSLGDCSKAHDHYYAMQRASECLNELEPSESCFILLLSLAYTKVNKTQAKLSAKHTEKAKTRDSIIKTISLIDKLKHSERKDKLLIQCTAYCQICDIQEALNDSRYAFVLAMNMADLLRRVHSCS